MEDFYLEDESQMESDRTGPRLLIDEIHAAINETKYETAASIDDISEEFLQLLDERALEVLTVFYVEIYEQVFGMRI